MKISISNLILYLAVTSIPFDFAIVVGGVRMTPTEALFSIALLLWLLRVVRAPQSLTLAPYFVPLLFFLAACLLSVSAAENKFLALRETVQFAWLFGLFYFFAHTIKDRMQALTLWSCVLAASVIVSLIGVYQYFFKLEPIHFLIAETRLRAHGAFDQPNTFASYLIGAIPFLFGFYFLATTSPQPQNKSGSIIEKIFLNRKTIVGFLLVLSAALVMSFSRGNWIGLAVGVAFLFFTLRKKAVILSFALLLVIMGSVALFVWADVSRQPALVARSFSNRQRVMLASTAFAMARDFPITGVGFGNFPVLLPKYASLELNESMRLTYDPRTKRWYSNPNKRPDIEIVHNTPLQVAAETGLIGLVAFVWLFLTYYLQAFKRLRASVDRQEYFMRAVALTSATAILAGGMFGWPFSHGVQELLMLSMALAVSPQTGSGSL